MESRNQVFLSYAHEDLAQVRKLYAGLNERGVNVWLDKEKLKVGRWKQQIEKAIAQSRYFIICLSNAALRKTGDEPGFQDEELNRAYNIAQEQPANSFAIIPVRLEECGRGDHRTTGFQQFDLFVDWDGTLDVLAVQLGGKSLSDEGMRDERSDLEKAREEFRGRAMAFYYAGDYENALKVWEGIAALYGDSYDTWFWKGMNLDELGRHEDSLDAYKKALSKRPQSRGTINNIGVVLTKLNLNNESLDFFDQVLEEDPDYALAWYNKALALDNLGRRKEAIACLMEVRRIDPEYMERHRDAWGDFMDILSRTSYFQDFDEGDFPFPEGPVAA
jgi:tetratricopeptide (TPR) repeat protein